MDVRTPFLKFKSKVYVHPPDNCKIKTNKACFFTEKVHMIDTSAVIFTISYINYSIYNNYKISKFKR